MVYFWEDANHRLVLDDKAFQLYIEASFGNEWIVVHDHRFANARSLSENFRDAIGHRDAVEALTAWGIDHTNLLWTLGYKGGETYWSQKNYS